MYSPAVSEKECKIKETKSFIDKVYHGSLKLLMANLVTDSSLSRDDELKLMEIIEKMEDGEKQ